VCPDRTRVVSMWPSFANSLTMVTQDSIGGVARHSVAKCATNEDVSTVRCASVRVGSVTARRRRARAGLESAAAGAEWDGGARACPGALTGVWLAAREVCGAAVRRLALGLGPSPRTTRSEAASCERNHSRVELSHSFSRGIPQGRVAQRDGKVHEQVARLAGYAAEPMIRNQPPGRRPPANCDRLPGAWIRRRPSALPGPRRQAHRQDPSCPRPPNSPGTEPPPAPPQCRMTPGSR
jgi:hypothetical protein